MGHMDKQLAEKMQTLFWLFNGEFSLEMLEQPPPELRQFLARTPSQLEMKAALIALIAEMEEVKQATDTVECSN